MDLRVDLMREWKEGESIVALAEIYQVSRKTIYKWIERYEAEGVAGLADRSRAPHHHPQTLSAATIEQITAARQRWKWGPRKLRVKLGELQPEVTWPAESTIGEVLKRAGLSRRRRPRQRTPPYEAPFAAITMANQTWCADFKGWFRTADRVRCDPLTISDAHSRYLLCCQIVARADTRHVEALFDATFCEYGLPDVIRTDNGPPFASCAPGGLSRLSLRWVKLGIRPERIQPASPQQNGRHERIHLTLKQETLQPPASTPRRQQEVFSRFQQIYNSERPHEALGNLPPAKLYQASPRRMPRRVPELEYAPDLVVRRIANKGELKWKGERTFISEVFAHELVALRPLDERYYELLFGPIRLGWFDAYRHRFHRQWNRRLAKAWGAAQPT